MISYDGMFLGTERELTLLMFAFLTGMVLGSVFDLFRALRLSIRHPGWAVAAEDIAFCLIFGLTFFSFCVELTEGQPRLFILAGMAAGFLVYLWSIGKIICGFLSKAADICKKPVKALVKLLKKAVAVLCGLPFLRRGKKKFQKELETLEDDSI